MSEDEIYECGCNDLATERARALVELALNIGAVREPHAKRAMLRAMDLLTDGIESAVRPKKSSGKGTIIPFRSA